MNTRTAAEMKAEFTSAEYAKQFIQAGHAIITLRSKVTGTRFTYKITKPRNGNQSLRFVALLRGPDNEGDYTYMGMISAQGNFVQTKASKIGLDAPSWKAFAWAWQLLRSNVIDDKLEIWHEGKCGRCGRTLTVPESIERGIGPECARQMGI